MPSKYFDSLSISYARQTGNSTRDIFASSFDLIVPAVVSSSSIHDNAGGVGTATSVILEKLDMAPHNDIPHVLITDNNKSMVAAAQAAFRDYYPRIRASELDSQDLSSLPDERFTLSVLNFSVSLFQDALKALREIHRTLRPDGLAAILTWKRFGFASTIHRAQALVRPDLPPLDVPGKQFMDEGVLANLMIKAGFDKSMMQVAQKESVQTGEDIQGMKEFMLADFSNMVTKDWSDNDRRKWPAAVEEAVRMEIKQHGGLKFEAWVVIARK